MDQNYITIVCISDTHCKFVELPSGDILIHCGDFSNYGVNEEIEAFIDWLVKQDFKHKIVIGGNHDLTIDKSASEFNIELKEKLLDCCHYLENSSIVLEGYKFWGSPYTIGPSYDAFSLNQNDSPAFWKNIEQNADIIVTHGPPFSILDKLHNDCRVGDKNLLEAISIIKPKYHIFGHIHESYGMQEGKNMQKDTQFINCSIMNRYYKPVNAPIVIKIPTKQ